MSQTETILLVVLGFSLAALIALFLGRFVWSLGLRLGARRMHKQMPSTVSGLQTERNRLRAEYAMLSQRLGARLETVKLQMAEQMAEVTRHRNRLENMTAEMAEKDRRVAAREAEILRLSDSIKVLEANAEALQAELAVRDTELALLRKTASDESRPIEFGAAGLSAEDRLKARIDQLSNMARPPSVESHNSAPSADVLADPVLRESFSDAARETEDLQKELERLDAEWTRKLDELGQVKPGETDPVRPGAVANVISLANRIRALKKDIAK